MDKGFFRLIKAGKFSDIYSVCHFNAKNME
jgi:hypothetical protein